MILPKLKPRDNDVAKVLGLEDNFSVRKSEWKRPYDEAKDTKSPQIKHHLPNLSPFSVYESLIGLIAIAGPRMLEK